MERTRKTERGWKYEEMVHRDYAEIISRRFGIDLDFGECVLKTLDDVPVIAFRKIARMGNKIALGYICSINMRDVTKGEV